MRSSADPLRSRARRHRERTCRRAGRSRRPATEMAVETIARGLDHPWALAFLPDGRMLVTERPGRMRIVDARRQALAAGRRRAARCAPPVRADCTTSCSTATSPPTRRSISASPSPPPAAGAPRWRARGSTTARRRSSTTCKVIFRQEGPLSSGNHYGCRIVQGRDGNLWLTMGDHFTYRDEAQNLANHLGKIVRVTPDGAVPPDNPFVGRQRREAGDLELRPPQLAGRGAASADRQAVGARARPARRRRDQHSARRQELRLAGDRLRHRLQRREDPRERPRRPAWSSRSNTGCRRSRPPAWRSTPAICSRPGRATCSSARSPAQMLVRLELDGEKVTKEERLLDQPRRAHPRRAAGAGRRDLAR